MKMLYDNECKRALIKGVDLAVNAIKTTYGPNGKNCIIHSRSGVKVTKDGATVAKAVTDPDPYVSIGIDYIKKISEKTASDIGDGSTTAAILAQAIIKEFKNKSNPIDVSRILKKDCEVICSYLDNIAKKSDEAYLSLNKVATLAANNDEELGSLVAKAWSTVGKTGIVNYVESEGINDYVTYNTGFVLETGYASPYFSKEGKVKLQNCMVYISDTKMEETKEVSKIAEKALKNKQSLLLVAPEFDSEVILFLTSNQDVLKSCAIISPNRRVWREIMLQDLKFILDESMVCPEVTVTQTTTSFIGFEKKPYEEKINNIQEALANTNDEYEKEFHQKRLANFTSGSATIHIGGHSDIEVKEKIDRIDDAIKATKAAFYGVVPGGGYALLQASKLPTSLSKVLKVPNKLLNKKLFQSIPKYEWNGVNVKTGKYANLYYEGILDPLMVTQTALRNAVNTASLILTCDCAILNFNDYE